MAPYIYKSLDLSTNAIRVLWLFGDPVFDNEIRCDLIETNLGEFSYEALSYTWGSINRPLKITVNGSELRVTKHLHAALQHLRLPDEDRLLWIDAICINQDDLRERGHQVGQMRLVYEIADRVLIWLGLSNPRIDNFFRTMDTYQPRTLAYLGRKPLRSIQEEDWLDLCQEVFREIGERSWCRRVWILQEIASAKAATIMCGHNIMSTGNFAIIPSLLDLDVTERFQAVLDNMPGHSRRGLWWNKDQDLESLLARFGASEATDERDKIYALLGFPPTRDTISYILFHEVIDLSTLGFSKHIKVQSLDALKDLVEATWKWALGESNWKWGFDKPTPRWPLNTANDKIILLLLGANTQHIAREYAEARALLCDLTYRHEHNALFQLVLHHGNVNVNVTDRYGNTPLHIAVRSKSIDKVDMLLRHDIASNVANAHGLTPIKEARGLEYVDILERLEVYAGRYNNNIVTAAQILMPIEEATSLEGRREMVRDLLAYLGMVVPSSDSKLFLDAVSRIHSWEALVEALKGQHSAMAALCLATSLAIKDFPLLKKELYMHSLQQGVIFGDVSAVNQFLQHYRAAVDIMVVWIYKPKIPIKGIYRNCSTALWAAAALGHYEIVNLLLQKGADFNVRDRHFDSSPCEVAAIRGWNIVVKRLRDHGAGWKPKPLTRGARPK